MENDGLADGLAALGTVSAPQSYAAVLRRRLDAVLASLPIGCDSSGSDEAVHIKAPAIEPLPDWLTIPVQLHEAWASERTGKPVADLGDVLWAQYALFLYIRLQDDVLDRQQEDLRLLFVADRFLLESLACIEQPELLSFYRARLRETVDGILDVRRLEARPGLFTTEHLGLHANVNGIFKVAAASVSALCGRPEEMSWIAPLMDRLAVFSQIGDDVCDLVQDLRAGRFTWVANVLLDADREEHIDVDQRMRRLADGLFDGERRARVVDELRKVAGAAASSVPPSAPSTIRDFAAALQGKADELDRMWHETSVRRVFADVP